MVSIAQQCLASDDSYGEAYARKLYYRQTAERKTFHFADGSCLEFAVSYTPIAAGRSFDEPSTAPLTYTSFDDGVRATRRPT